MNDAVNMSAGDRAAGTTGSGRGYLHDITIAKGLAIFLVVFGHVVTGPPPQGNDWYMVIRAAVYGFHMPFFIFLSGYIFFYTNSADRAWASFGSFIARRAERLLVPFLLFGLLIIAGKHIAQQFIHVDNVSRSILLDVVNLFLYTGGSAAKNVWYVFVLFEMTIFAVLALRVIRSPLIWFVITLPFSTIFLTPVLYLDRFFLFLPYFFLGGVAIAYRERWLALLDRRLWIFWLLFIVTIIVTRLLGIFSVTIVACGLTSIPALHGLSRRVWMQRSKLLDLFGRYSFPIYLLNTVGIGLMKGVLFQFMSWNGPRFLIFFPILLFVGLIGPILVKTQIFRRVAYLDKITD